MTPPSDWKISAADKGLPATAAGDTVRAFLASRPRLDDLWTPLLVVGEEELDANIAFLARWVADRGLELMPHGKTTMSPQLWRKQLAAGATAITVATPSQARVAADAGVPAVQLANQLAQPAPIRWAADTVARGTRLWSWVDDVAAVERIDRVLAETGGDARLEVLIDVGRIGGRTGTRDHGKAVELARRVAASPFLRLAGVAGYEGAVTHGRDASACAAVTSYIDEMIAVHRAIAPLYDDGDVLVTAGGSAYPDLVAEAFTAARDADQLGGRTRFALRSGAYIVHDHGYYREHSPFDGQGLRPAARGIARVVSRREPGTAIVDGGKRDFPYDEGMPVPLFAIDGGGTRRALPGATVTKLADQHGFVSIPPETLLQPGDVIVFGLSHPCTMFDKWRAVPVVDDLDDLASAVVTDLLETRF